MCRPLIRQRLDASQRRLTMKKITTAKHFVNFGHGTLPWQPILWRETATTPTSWYSPSLLFVMAFYNGCEDRGNPDKPSTSVKITAENPWHVVVSLLEVDGSTHAKIRTFALFPVQCQINLRQTFKKYRRVSRLHNKGFQLRRLAQGKLLW